MKENKLIEELNSSLKEFQDYAENIENEEILELAKRIFFLLDEWKETLTKALDNLPEK